MPPQKHIYQSAGFFTNFNTNGTFILAKGVLNPDPYTNHNNVRNGSLIKAITIQLDWAVDVSPHEEVLEWYVWFNVGGAQTQPDPQAVGNSILKNQVFHQDGGFAALFSSIGAVRPRSWRVTVMVPRSLQQINESDQIELVMKTGDNSASCAYRVCAIYKEYFP